MNARVWLNGSTKEIESDLGGGAFDFPTIVQGETMFLRFRVSQTVGDFTYADSRAIHSVRARIGWQDTAPTQGDYELTISHGGSSVVVSDIPIDATAASLTTLINTELDGVIAALHPCVVTDYSGSLRIKFADNTIQPTITCTDNELWPKSFVKVDEVEHDEGYVYRLKLRQTPVAETSTVTAVVPDPPTISRLQTGSTSGDVAINEVQKLFIPPEFSGGSFLIVRSGTKTTPISVPIRNIDDVSTPLAALVDEGGTFTLSQVSDGFYIEFAGDMAGEPHDLMTIEVFESPGTDYLVRLETDTDEMDTLLLGADSDNQIEVPFNLKVEVADGVTDGEYQPLIFQDDLIIERAVSDDSGNVSASLKWNQPLSEGDYLSFSTDSLLIGNRAVEFTIGDGSATEFTLNHNLGENGSTFTVNAGTDLFTAAGHNLQNLDPVEFSTSGTLPDPLDSTLLYFVLVAEEDTFQVSLTPNGAAVDLTDTGSGTHTVKLRDGVTTGVVVDVWETAGNEERIPQSDYTVEKLSADSVKISGFASTPTSGQYKAYIQTYGRPATYQAHTHEIDETPEAKTRIEALEARVLALENRSGTGTFKARTVGYGATVRRSEMEHFVEAYPLRQTVTLPESGDLTLVDLNQLPERAGGLLPAVHDTASESLSAILSGGRLPRADDSYVGRVFENDHSTTVQVIGGGGRKTSTLKVGEYVACSGSIRDGGVWYRVNRFEAAHAGVTFTADATEDTITLGTADDLKVGDVVRLTTTTTLPAGLSLATDYWILDDFQLATSATGSAVNITDTGTGTHTATRQAESTWYPTDFDRVLYQEVLGDRKFPEKTEYRMDFAIETMIRNADTTMQWVLVIEEGTFPQKTDVTPAGANLSDPVWNTANPVLEERIIVDKFLSTDSFGFKVARTVSEGSDVFTAYAIYYGNEVATRAPLSADVAYRVRLVRADTEDSIAYPKGTVLLAGMKPFTAIASDSSVELGVSAVRS